VCVCGAVCVCSVCTEAAGSGVCGQVQASVGACVCSVVLCVVCAGKQNPSVCGVCGVWWWVCGVGVNCSVWVERGNACVWVRQVGGGVGLCGVCVCQVWQSQTWRQVNERVCVCGECVKGSKVCVCVW